MLPCGVHPNGSDIHCVSLQTVQDVLTKTVPALKEQMIIIFQCKLLALDPVMLINNDRKQKLKKMQAKANCCVTSFFWTSGAKPV